jgi:hypothetical protein
MNMTFFVSNLPDDGDEFVPYEGKVFEAGQYPDKDFSMSEEELEERAVAFIGVDLDLEHSQFRDLLGHRLGRLEKIWRDGRDALGRLSIPRWLHELCGGRLQTSLTFDRGKNIVGCALTLSPRIPDAEIAAAFGAGFARAHEPASGSSVVGTLPEFTCEVLPSPEDLPNRSSRADSPAAPFPQENDRNWAGNASPVEPTSPVPMRILMPTRIQGGRQTRDFDTDTNKEIEPMPTSFKDRLRVLFSKAPEAVQEAGIDPEELDTTFADGDKPVRLDPAIEAQLTEFKATNERLVASQLATCATLFADDVVRTAKAVPAQKQHLIALFKGAAIADGQGVVRFSDNGTIAEGANLTALRDLFKDALPHSLFTTQIPNADPNADSSTPDPAMVEKLRTATHLGRQTIKKEAN